MFETRNRLTGGPHWRSLVAVAAIGLGAGALPAGGQAAQSKSVTYHYNVSVKRLALAKGTNVKTKIVVTAPEASVKSWSSQATVGKVVRKGVNGGYQRPYTSEGYRCSVVVRGETTSYTCRIRGADVPTSIVLSFAVVFRGATRSG
jgi:hypothetical protein